MFANTCMYNTGTHGAGHSHETRTPFISWGSGVAKQPTPLHEAQNLDMSKSILQADIAPYMASLLGIGVPVNNVVSSHSLVTVTVSRVSART